MTSARTGPARLTAALALVMLALLLLPGATVALPGDLSAELSLKEDRLEAAPQEVEDTVTFHGNITFTQPFYQYASASITATLARNWTVSVEPPTVRHRGSGDEAFTVSVTVPPNARGREVAALHVSAEYSTRFGDPQVVTDSGTVTVRSWVAYRLNVTEPVELVLPQGRSASLLVPLLNVGNEPEYFSTSVPYWYGLRPLGLDVEAPTSVLVREKEEVSLKFELSAQADTVPRAYVFDLVVDAQSLLPGGEGASQDPRTVTVEVMVVGQSPPDDPYRTWTRGNPPSDMPPWENLFGSSQHRRHPDVDPAGSHITFDQTTVEGERAIHLGDTQGSGAYQLTRGHYDHHPVFSPNGRMIAFSRAPDRIIVMNLNGTELMEFGVRLGEVNLTDWSSSGDRILFDSSGDIHELDIRTNTTRMLAGEPVDQWGAVYSPDGGRVYYISYEAAGRRPEIWYMTSDGSGHTQLTFNDLTERFVSPSPNGRRVAFALQEFNRTGDRLCVMDPDGSDVRYFTDDQNVVHLIRWMPDGKGLVAETSISLHGAHDIQRVRYPWRDAGFHDAGPGGGGPGGAAAAGGGFDLPSWMTGPTFCLAGVLVALVAAGAALLLRRRRRQRDEAARRLREITGRGKDDHQAGPVQEVNSPDDWYARR